jgi:hypothetical protein
MVLGAFLSSRARDVLRTLLLAGGCFCPASYATDDAKQLGVVADFQLEVAQFSPAGELLRPDDLDQWIFLGTSLGLGYAAENTTSAEAKGPGDFQVVLMEPTAYRYFKANGRYADGSMFLLAIYGTEHQQRADRSGFSQRERKFFEIHLIDKQRYADGRAFFLYPASTTAAKALPPGNDCVACHVQHAAFGGTFAQFYPAVRQLVPPGSLLDRH